MNWGSDELHHRSAEQSGWCAELRAAHPEDVDGTVPGAVAYAAETAPSDDATLENVDTDSRDAEDPADPADAEDGEDASRNPADANADEADEADDADGYVCSFCGGDIPDGEALDADGAPVDVGFDWLADVEAYHRSCIERGEGRFLPWAANGVLNDETTR